MVCLVLFEVKSPCNFVGAFSIVSLTTKAHNNTTSKKRIYASLAYTFGISGASQDGQNTMFISLGIKGKISYGEAAICDYSHKF